MSPYASHGLFQLLLGYFFIYGQITSTMTTKLSSAATSGLAIRLLPLILLAIPLAVSIGFIAIRNVRLYGYSRAYISRNRPTVAVVVQIVASILGILQVTALTLAVNYRARIILTKRPVKSDTMDLLTALSVPRIAWSLPAAKLGLAALVVVLAQGPGALWAGSITPAVTREPIASGNFVVPKFSTWSSDVWDAEFLQKPNGDVWNQVENCTSQRSQAGAVTNCPVPNHQATLLDSLRGATSWTETTRNHSKPDSSAWTYVGRSYGMGASLGLVTAAGISDGYKLLGFSYNETGYETSISCQYNASSELTLDIRGEAPNVDVWYVTGLLPNSIREEYYPVVSWARANKDNAVVLGWAGVATGSQYMIGITSSPIYGNFTNIQCSVTFTPRVFTVSVNQTASLITVNTTDLRATDMEPSWHLKKNAIWSVNLLSRMSTSLYISVLGEALQQNLEATRSRYETLNTSEGALRSTQDSFEAILDDILGIYAGAQISLAKDVGSTPIVTFLEGMRFGDTTFQLAVAILTAITVVIVLIEGALTRGWQELPLFDPLAFKCITAAASLAGPALGSELKERHAVKGTQWLGEASDRTLGAISVMLVEKAGSMQLVLGNSYASADSQGGEELTRLTAPGM
jgi:hypothetical protein